MSMSKEELFKKMNSANVDTVYDIIKKNPSIIMMHKLTVSQCNNDSRFTTLALQAYCVSSKTFEGETGCIIKRVAYDLLFSMIDMRLRMEYEVEKGEKEDEN